MHRRLPLILQIQADAIDSSTSIVQVVRTAKLAAFKLQLTDAIDWIDDELNGYKTGSHEKLPPYRVIRGECQAMDISTGTWLPVNFHHEKSQAVFCTAGITQPLASLEHLAQTDNGGHLERTYPPQQQEILRDYTGYPSRFRLRIAHSAVTGILDGVRSATLNWSLRLEAAGILGENMSFKEDEQRVAHTATQSFFIQNAGVIGNVTDQASVSITQNASIDINKAGQTLEQIRSLVPMLPENIQQEIAPALEQSTACLEQKEPDQKLLKTLMTSIKTICEAAAGNVIATGIAASIGALF